MHKKSVLGVITTAATALGINAVPLGGFFVLGWAAEAAMLLYLIENMISVSLAAARVYLLAPAREDIPGSKPRNRKELVEGFLMVGLGLSAVCTVFILAFIFLVLRAEVEPAVIQSGLVGILIFQLFGFSSDLLLLRPLSLARAEMLLQTSLGRVALLYLAVFIGVCAAAYSNHWFLIPFALLKLMVDIGQPIQFLLGKARGVAIDSDNILVKGVE